MSVLGLLKCIRTPGVVYKKRNLSCCSSGGQGSEIQAGQGSTPSRGPRGPGLVSTSLPSLPPFSRGFSSVFVPLLFCVLHVHVSLDLGPSSMGSFPDP